MTARITLSGVVVILMWVSLAVGYYAGFKSGRGAWVYVGTDKADSAKEGTGKCVYDPYFNTKNLIPGEFGKQKPSD